MLEKIKIENVVHEKFEMKVVNQKKIQFNVVQENVIRVLQVRKKTKVYILSKEIQVV